MSERLDGAGYIVGMNLKGEVLIARPGDSAFKCLQQIEAEIAAAHARREQLRAECRSLTDEWWPLPPED